MSSSVPTQQVKINPSDQQEELSSVDPSKQPLLEENLDPKGESSFYFDLNFDQRQEILLKDLKAM